MRKIYSLNGILFEFESNGSQDYLITDEMVALSNDDILRVINPEKYLSDEEKAQLDREFMPTLTPIEFDLLLDKHNLYDEVQELIKNDRTLSIAYTRATFFSRTDPFIDQARIALNLTDEQVDEMWLS